jgi:predicted Rossmann-fold nucleotide-binding protein
VTAKVRDFPVVLMGVAYWQGLLSFLTSMQVAGAIDLADVERLIVTDDPVVALAALDACCHRHFGSLKPPAAQWPARFLGESLPGP